MSFKDILGDSFKAAIRNPGDVGGVLRSFRNLQAQRKADDAHARTVYVMGQYARAGYDRALAIAHGREQEGPWHEQFQNEDFRVDVRSGFSRDHQRITTEIEVYYRHDNPDAIHYHYVVDDRGELIFEGERTDRQKGIKNI